MTHSDLPLVPPLPAADAIGADLHRRGWSVQRDFFPAALTTALHDELDQLREAERLRAARIGRGQERQRRVDIRGDHIHWLNGASEAQRAYLFALEGLRLELNRRLFMGLEDLEAHFALYPPGTGYRRHMDSFQGDNLRRISTVTYLNPDWAAADGGGLLLFDGDAVIETILPEAGTLVCFVSEDIPHEVALTRRPRASIAGWFRIRPLQEPAPLVAL
jgi:SM-20-related protein